MRMHRDFSNYENFLTIIFITIHVITKGEINADRNLSEII